MSEALTHPTWDNIEQGSAQLASLVIEQQLDIDIILGVTRGGLIPAVIISHIMEIPLLPISYSATTGKGDNKWYDNEIPNVIQPNILIVDDICDSGETLDIISSSFIRQGHNVYSAVLYYKTDAKCFPTFYWQRVLPDSDWIHFPWE